MIGLDVISAILLAIYATILFHGNDQVWIVALVMIVLSTISTIYQPVVNTCIPVIIKKGESRSSKCDYSTSFIS